NRPHHLLGGVSHRATSDNRQARFSESLFTGLDVVALQPDDERQFEAGFFHGGDDAGGNDVAVHDPAENVDQNPLHVVVLEDDLKRGGDLFLAGAAADIEK